MRSQILKLKLELKNLAKTIRITKRKRCAENNGYIPELEGMRSRYRHMHVVYCLIRGKTLEQVDSGKGLNMAYVEFHLDALKNDNKKLYVIVDKNLSSSQQAVQSCHAVAAFCKKYPATTWSNGTIVLLKDDFKYTSWQYNFLPYEKAEFKEPDLNNALTAYCAYGPGLEENFKKLPLV